MDLRYPVGKYQDPIGVTKAERDRMIEEIAQLPSNLRKALAALPAGGLDRSYREGGWTGRQLVHHLADSHMNSYIRCKFALAQDTPTIMPYDEAVWAEMADASTGDVEMSLSLLEGLHMRWAMMFRSLTEQQWERKYLHPEMGVRDLAQTVALYAWHSRHHVAHLGLIQGSAAA